MSALLVILLLVSFNYPIQSLAQQLTASDKRIICFYSSWAYWRQGDGNFQVSDIDPSLCTHAVYAFAGIDNVTHEIKSSDPYLDLPDDFGVGNYYKFTALSNTNPGLKTFLSVGGYNEGGHEFSVMASTAQNRQAFVSSAVSFLQYYGFDGLDVDWEYPTLNGGSPDDKQNFVSLLSELKTALEQHGLLLSVVLAAGKPNIDAAYDIPGIAQYVDFMSIMAYDYHGSWEPYTGLNAPLYPSLRETGGNLTLNFDWTVMYYLELGAPPSKLNVGLATYGRSFELSDPQQHGCYAPSRGPGAAGPYTQQAGSLGYNEICLNFGTWTRVYDSSYRAPYAYLNNQWVGYDDVQSITAKCQYINSANLGGAMLWSLETDDFRGRCDEQAYPLLTTINEQLRGSSFKETN